MRTLFSFLQRVVGSAAMCMLLSSTLLAPPVPLWWNQRGATDANPADDYAAANLGQLKQMASKAAVELNAHPTIGAGTTINNLIASWHQPPATGVTRDDSVAATVGQLKAVSKPFYDRLTLAGLASAYPWSLQTTDDDDLAVANLGQLKRVFAFDLTAPVPEVPTNSPPNPLPNGGNSPVLPTYSTATPGGGGAGPQIDQSHDANYSHIPYPVGLLVTPGSYTDDGVTIPDPTMAHLEWSNGTAAIQSIVIQRRDSNANWNTIASASPSDTEYDDGSALLASVNYLYRVVIKYGNGQTLMSNNAPFSVPLFSGFSYRIGEVKRYNPGFKEFSPGTTPKYYLIETKDCQDYDNPIDEGGYKGTYHQVITVDPTVDPPDDKSYSGEITWTENSNSGGPDPYTTTYNQSPNGDWNPDLPPFYFPGGGEETRTPKVLSYTELPDSHATYTSSITLDSEYLIEDFFQDTIDRLHYSDWHDNSGYWFESQWSWDIGYWWWDTDYTRILQGWGKIYRDHNATNDYLEISKVQYKFQTNPSAPVAIKFYDLFLPDANGSENPPLPRVVGSHTLSVGAAGGESTNYILNPATEPDAFSPGCATGRYFIVEGINLEASGFIPDLTTHGGGDYSSLDSQEKTSGITILSPSGTDGRGAITGWVNLPDLGLPGAIYTIHLSGGSGFRVKDSYGNTITDGEQISEEDIRNGLYSLTFTVTATSTAGNGQHFTITISVNDSNGGSLGEDLVTFTNRTSAARDFSIPLDEATGSRYRKIGLNGRPLGDEKPHQTAESDEEKEETYIDALTLGLRHSTTDVYISVPGSDLALTARRETLSEVWNMHSGLRPHERLDRPFGPGWSSNLCLNMEVYNSSDGESYVYITDQNGARHRFFYAHIAHADGSYTYGYVPLPSDARENGDYLTSFDGIIFTDRFGTKIYFDYDVFIWQRWTTDRAAQSGGENHYYYGVSKIVDRYGNTLTYTYPDPATVKTLIPKTITVEGSVHQTLSIEQDSEGHIKKIWDPNGNQFTYAYTPKSYTLGDTNYVVPTLTSVTGPDEKSTVYGYNYSEETDRTPPALTNDQPVPKAHLDVSSITDANSNTYTFGYAFDQTRQNYNTATGPFKQTGAPRNVVNITLPGGLGNTTFENQSLIKLKVPYNPDGKPVLSDDSHRRIVVTDAGGNKITYRFGEGKDNNQRDNSQVFDVGGFYPSTPQAAIPKIVFYKTMEIDYDGGYEKFTFDPSAGLALSSVRDFSENTTSYTYDDDYTPPLSELYPKVFPLEAMMTKYSDPTSQTDALSQSKSFTYGLYRIMDSVTDENGRYTSYQLDTLQHGARRLNEVVHSTGPSSAVEQTTEFAYEDTDFPGVVTKKTVKKLNGPSWSVDLVTKYVLDGNGRVWKEIVDPDNLALTTITTYDRNGNKLSVTDPKTHTTWFEYDPRNRLTRVIYADGSDKKIDYYPNGNKWHESDENTHVTSFTYDALNRLKTQTRTATMNGTPTPLVTRFGYLDAVRPKTSVIDPNQHETTMEYDSLMRLTHTTDADNKTTIFDYSGPNAGAHAFDSSGFKPTLITDPRGYKTQLAYDELYRLRVKDVQYQLNPPLYSHTEIDYDGVGNPTETRDPLTHSTVTQFDALNRPYHITFADGMDLWTFYTPTGLKWLEQDELGNQTETQYDGAGRPVVVSGPLVDDGLNPEQVNRFSHMKHPLTQTIYDDAGNVSAMINPLGQQWVYFYDERNRKIEEDQPEVVDAASGTSQGPTLHTGYDYVGNILWAEDARGYTSESTYDEVNRPLVATLPPIWVYGVAAVVRPTTSKTYDRNGNVLTVTDANSHTTTNTYDWLNRLKTTLDAQNILVQNEYDAAGNLTKVTDGKSQITQFDYDGLNRNTSIKDFANKSTTFEYNGINKTTRTDALSHVTSYGYDLRNRLQTVTYTGRSADNRTYYYDDHGNLTSVSEPGKGGTADVAYSYDALNRVQTETSSGLEHTYVYDLAGNRLSTTYGGTGRVLTSTYDHLNRLSTLKDESRTTKYGYDLTGNVTKKTLPNGEMVLTSYDGLNRAQSIVGKRADASLNYEYLNGYDKGGNVRWINEYYSGLGIWRGVVMDYDNANRLWHEIVTDQTGYTKTTTFGYDDANNRTGSTVTNTSGATAVTSVFGFNSLNQLTSYTETGGSTARNVGYTYDFMGNRKTRVENTLTDTYGYDYEHRLVSLTKNTPGGTGAYAYTYDYRTRRVVRTEGSASTKLVFSGGTSVQEYNGTGSPISANLTAEYVRGSDWGGGVGGILYSVRATIPSYNHYDRRGDVTVKTNGSGAVTYQANYKPFGQHPNDFGSTQDRQKANTKEEDPTGLLNEGMRYRDLETGVFITRDPAGFVDGPNLYAYVKQNPWTAFDPEGLSTELRLDGQLVDHDDNESSFSVVKEKQQATLQSARDIEMDNFQAVGNPTIIEEAQKAANLAQEQQDLASGDPGKLLYYAFGHAGETTIDFFGEALQQAPFLLAGELAPALRGLGIIGRGVEEASIAAKTPLSNSQLIQSVATRAENAVGGSGRFAGTAKHAYADELLTRYQNIYGQRGLVTESTWLNGVAKPYGTKGAVRLDVLDTTSSFAYDYKFTLQPPGLSQSRIQQIMNHGPNLNGVFEINP